MRGGRSFETLRIFLPGAVVLVLIDISARFFASLETTNGEPWASLPGAADVVTATIEDPFAAVVIAFGLGLLLYWFDPAYGAPEYYRGIPSAYLGELLERKGLDSSISLSLYMHALNEKMSEPLAERALQMGAMYRIGFDTVFATFSIGVVIAWLCAVTLGAETAVLNVSRLQAAGGWFATALLLTIGFTVKTRPTKDGDWWPAVGRASAIAVPALIGVTAFVGLNSEAAAGWALTVGFAIALGSWMVFRLRGPEWADWLKSTRDRGARSFIPSKTFALWELAMFDGALVSGACLLMVSISGGITRVQLATPSVLLILSLVLAYQRKYERQLHGVYFNQQTWIDLNVDYLVKTADELLAAKKERKAASDAKKNESSP